MRVVLATVGTRGDVQPMLALARALARRGHDAVLCCPATFAAWVTSFGVEHRERVAAVVHHGGAGTVAAALRAGVPQIVLPMMLDRFLHQHMLVRAGLAPRAPTMAKVNAKSLARAVNDALALPAEPRRTVAERIARSDGAAAIVDVLERLTGARARQGAIARAPSGASPPG